MPTNRKCIFVNDQIYHVYNRGIERRTVFMNKREYQRALETLKYYQLMQIPKKFSEYLNLSLEAKELYINNIYQKLKKQIEIIAYCLMPNHFHFLIQQKEEGGIQKFMANFTNSYTKYFNTKHARVGPLFQGIFKAIHIETTEQLIHISRYIHLNPVASFITQIDKLEKYPWSSYGEYINLSLVNISNPSLIINSFKSIDDYKKFVSDQVLYPTNSGLQLFYGNQLEIIG